MPREESRLPQRMDLLTLLEDHARLVAQRLGHDLGPLQPSRLGEHLAACRRCSALAIITPSHRIGVHGTACSVSCRTRRRLRLIHGSAAMAGSIDH